MTVNITKKLAYTLLFVVSAAFILLAYKHGKSQDINGDYYIYWLAGKNFSEMKTIYQPGLLDGGFVYPPFAAMIFQVSAWFPFQLSAILYSFFVNYLLWLFSLYLSFKILKLLFPQQKIIPSVLLAALLSARFYWHNFIWSQANLPVLCATLAGIYFYFKKQYTYSYAFFLFGCFFKITPGLFLLFIALKKGYKDWIKILLLSIPFILLPLLLRGFERGMQDWANFYRAFVEPFAKGKADQNIISLGIPSFLNKMNSGNSELMISPIISLSEPALKFIILSVQIVLFAAVAFKIWHPHLRNKRTGLTGADFALLFLLILILPGRVWEHHHVTTGFIYSYVLLLLSKLNKMKLRYVFIVLASIIDIIGSDTVGKNLYLFSQFYAVITFFMLLIFVFLLYLSVKHPAVTP